MPRYALENDPGGKKVLPSPTEIGKDTTNKSGALTQWAANMTVEWIRENAYTIDPHENLWVDDGQEYWRISSGQLNDARFNFRNVSQEALDVGSAVHKAIENYLKTGREPKIDHDQILSGFIAFLEWKDKNKLKPIALEKTVYGNCWAGTLDFLGYLNGELYVIDFKTSKAIYPDMYTQVAAYRSAAFYTPPESEIAISPAGSGILRLDKESGQPEFKDISHRHERDLKEFNAMLNLYMIRHPRIAKNAGWKGE